MKWVRRAARRVRVRSIILSGHRKRFPQWRAWLSWELCKSFALPLLLLPVELFIAKLPDRLWLVILVTCGLYSAFVLVNAGVVALRLNNRRAAFLKAAGYDLSLSSVLKDPAAWRISQSSGTMREFLKTRRK